MTLRLVWSKAATADLRRLPPDDRAHVTSALEALSTAPTSASRWASRPRPWPHERGVMRALIGGSLVLLFEVHDDAGELLVRRAYRPEPERERRRVSGLLGDW